MNIGTEVQLKGTPWRGTVTGTFHTPHGLMVEVYYPACDLRKWHGEAALEVVAE